MTLHELCRHDREPKPWRLEIFQREVGGGKATLADLDRIDAHPEAIALAISGLDQPMFERLISRYASRFSALHFWKCPRLADLTPLESLPTLTHVAFYWNQRTARLWNFAKTPGLQGLQFDDFSRLRDLAELEYATSLTELRFGNMIWPKATFTSLDPLRHLATLRALSFDAKRIDDGRVQPLAALQQLDALGFPAHQFTTEQVAWLRARLPDSLRSPALLPFRTLVKPLPSSKGPQKDVLLVGKRKPFLNSIVHASRISRHVDEFQRMVEDFRQHPEKEPASLS
jgi:hypothetical protein